MKFEASCGCSLIRGATGRISNYLNSTDATDEQLIKEWVKAGDLHHPGAAKFRDLITGLKSEIPELLLFRGRFKSEDMQPMPSAGHFGPPRKDEAKAGRYNQLGRPVLYLATSANGVVRELCAELPPVDLYCQNYRLPFGVLRVANFSSSDLENFVHIAFDYAEYGLGSGGINDREYGFSQVLAEIVEAAGYEGMIVPGVRAVPDARYCNVVLFSIESWEEWVVGKPFLLT